MRREMGGGYLVIETLGTFFFVDLLGEFGRLERGELVEMLAGVGGHRGKERRAFGEFRIRIGRRTVHFKL